MPSLKQVLRLQVLVGEEQELLALLETPGDDFLGVGASADGATVLAHEGFQGGRAVDVGDRHYFTGGMHGQERLSGRRGGWPCRRSSNPLAGSEDDGFPAGEHVGGLDVKCAAENDAARVYRARHACGEFNESPVTSARR